MSLLPLIVLSLLSVQCAQGEDGPTVEINQGHLTGVYETSRNGRQFNAFYMVPYASAGRFEAPKPAGKWTGVYNATNNDIECVQFSWWTNKLTGQEDCLKLNVYSPNLQGNYPVMVSLHCGSFTFGGAKEYSGNYIMDEDVVLVTINYRLGALGFLSTQDEVFPGNNGLKDQSAALRWVQENIKSFGGDPTRVTIFGVSAGGASVSYQVLSPLSAGLFHAAIPQSAAALNPWAFSRKPLLMAARFAEAIGCPTKSTELLKCLKGKSLEEILAAQNSLTEWGYDPFVPFGPVAEPDLPGAFLSEEPKVALENGRFNKVPIMTGLSEDEGILMHSAYILEKTEVREDLQANWKKVLPITLQFNQVYTNFSQTELEEMAVKVKEFYFGDKDIGVEETRQELTDAFSDRLFNSGVREAAILQSKHTPVYLYLFTYNRGEFSNLQMFGIPGNFGVTHGDEMSFLYPHWYKVFPEFEKGSASEQMSINLVKLWTSFARETKPSALWSTLSWNAITPAEARGSKALNYMKLDISPSVVQEPFTSRVHFWKDLLQDASKSSSVRDEL